MLIFDGDAIVYRERPLPLALRLFAGFLGLGIAIVIPTPFIIHADWTTLSPSLALAAASIVAPLLIGPFFVVIALASATELRLDPATGWADRRQWGPVINRRDRFRLSEMAAPEVIMRESSEDGPFPILRLNLPARGKLDMACFADQAEAEHWRDRIARVLHRKRGQRR